MIFQTKNKKAKKLTAGQVAEMRQHYENGATQGALCKYYKVSVGQVGRIVRGESWAEGALDRGPSLEEIDAMGERHLAQQQARDAASPEVARLAAEFAAVMKQPASAADYGARQAPRSPLEGGEGDDGIAPTGLSQLEQHAKDYGLDIDKLRQAGAT